MRTSEEEGELTDILVDDLAVLLCAIGATAPFSSETRKGNAAPARGPRPGLVPGSAGGVNSLPGRRLARPMVDTYTTGGRPALFRSSASPTAKKAPATATRRTSTVGSGRLDKQGGAA
jgi:hypothetical protein